MTNFLTAVDEEARQQLAELRVIVDGLNQPFQCCPVCEGRGNVPHSFYSRMVDSTSTSAETCRACHGAGVI